MKPGRNPLGWRSNSIGIPFVVTASYSWQAGRKCDIRFGHLCAKWLYDTYVGLGGESLVRTTVIRSVIKRRSCFVIFAALLKASTALVSISAI